MKIVYSGGKYKVFSDGITVYDELPRGTYEVDFDMQEGFYLTKVETIKVTVPQIFGQNTAVVDRILSRYADFDRSMGVALTGFKGSGKTLTAAMLSERLYKEGVPTVIVKEHTPKIFTFINSISTPALVLFDEFEKNFLKGSSRFMDAEIDPAVLTYLDGATTSKKLNLLISNSRDLTEFLTSRPGRVYYNYVYNTLGKEEISEFLMAKCTNAIPEEVDLSISIISSFSRAGGSVSYDMLSAIAKELNYGETFDSALKFLNVDLKMTYPVAIELNRSLLEKDFEYDASQGFMTTEFVSDQFSDEDGYWKKVRIGLRFNILELMSKRRLEASDIEFEVLDGNYEVNHIAIRTDND